MAKFIAACVVVFGFLFWASHGVTRGLVVFAAILLALVWFTQHRNIPVRIRRPEQPHPEPLIHVDTRMGVRPTVLGHAVPIGYRLACLYLGSGLIDRTRTLDHGFPYTVLDPIPELPEAGQVASLADLVSERAKEIVEAARRRDVPIRLLWSGGIDSTAACCALLRALGGDVDKLEVCYNGASRREYPDFFYNVVKPHLKRRKVWRITDALDPKFITLKEIIFEFTHDGQYRDDKLKVPSLGGTLRAPAGSAGLAIDTSRSFLSEALDATLEAKQAAGSVPGLDAETDFDPWREAALWKAIKGHSE